MDLKNNLISMKVGIKDDSGRAHLPFRTATGRHSQEKYIPNEDVRENVENVCYYLF